MIYIPIIPEPRDLFKYKLATPHLLEQCSTASQHIPFKLVGAVVEKGSTRELDVSLLGSFKYTYAYC